MPDAKSQKQSRTEVLAKSLQRPMTGTELLETMRRQYPKAQLRSIWLLLKNLERKELVFCLNPGDITGRLYYFTDKGRRWLKRSYGVEASVLPPLLNWKKYAQIIRAQNRKAILIQIGTFSLVGEKPEAKTISVVRKQLLRKQIHISLNVAIRAVRELVQLNLVRKVGVTKKRNSPLYLPTIIGKRIIKLLEAR